MRNLFLQRFVISRLACLVIALLSFGCGAGGPPADRPENDPGSELVNPPETTPPPEVVLSAQAGKVVLPEGSGMSAASLFARTAMGGTVSVSPAGSFQVHLNSEATGLVEILDGGGRVLLVTIAPQHPLVSGGGTAGEVGSISAKDGDGAIGASSLETAKSMVFLQPGITIADPLLAHLLLKKIGELPETQALAGVIEARIAAGLAPFEEPDAGVINALVSAVNALQAAAAGCVRAGKPVAPRKAASDAFSMHFTPSPGTLDEVWIEASIDPAAGTATFDATNTLSRWVILALEKPGRPERNVGLLPPAAHVLPGLSDMLFRLGSDLWNGQSLWEDTRQGWRDMYAPTYNQVFENVDLSGYYDGVLATCAFPIIGNDLHTWESAGLTMATEIVMPAVSVLFDVQPPAPLEKAWSTDDAALLRQVAMDVFQGPALDLMATHYKDGKRLEAVNLLLDGVSKMVADPRTAVLLAQKTRIGNDQIGEKLGSWFDRTLTRINACTDALNMNLALGDFLDIYAHRSPRDQYLLSVPVPPQAPVATPTLDPDGGAFNDYVDVVIATATPGASIRYTTDGSAPDASTGSVYSGPVRLTTTTTLKAIAYKAGMADSAVASATFTRNVPGTVAMPAFTPPGGDFIGSVDVTISTATAGAAIRYTTDGAAPTPSVGTVYTGQPVHLTATTTLKAIAYKDGMVDSPVVSATFTLTPPPAGMARIPTGEFLMGDAFSEGSAHELPRHAVHLSAFFIDQTQVTNQQYADALNWAWNQGDLITVITGTVYNSGANYLYCETNENSPYSQITWNGSTFGVPAGKEDYPMVMVSWYGSVAYANWRSGMEGRPLAYDLSTWSCDFNGGYRLPTEAEWEKAARGGAAGHRFPWSDSDTIQHARANYFSSSDNSYDTSPTPGHHPTFGTGWYPYTSPASAFAANGYGLYDMAGNVWEWCNDWYSDSYYSDSPYNDPRGPSIGADRVLRGGDWEGDANRCRVAFRRADDPAYRNDTVGFRLVLDSP